MQRVILHHLWLTVDDISLILTILKKWSYKITKKSRGRGPLSLLNTLCLHKNVVTTPQWSSTAVLKITSPTSVVTSDLEGCSYGYGQRSVRSSIQIPLPQQESTGTRAVNHTIESHGKRQPLQMQDQE